MADFNIPARRAFLAKSLETAFLVATGALSVSSASHAMGKIPKELVPGKSIYELKGKVLVDGKPATSKTVVTADSLVETGSNAYVVFVVGKDAHILRENSRVQFSGAEALVNTMRVLTGKLLSVFGHRTGGERPLKLETTTATIGIRGTGVYTEVDDDKSYVCTCYGSTEISSTTDQNSEIIVSMHHDAPRYVLKEPRDGKTIIPAPVINHTDEELMLIEALVGRKPPFANINDYNAPTRGY